MSGPPSNLPQRRLFGNYPPTDTTLRLGPFECGLRCVMAKLGEEVFAFVLLWLQEEVSGIGHRTGAIILNFYHPHVTSLARNPRADPRQLRPWNGSCGE